MRLLKVFLANVAAFGVAAAISSSCSVDYPSTAFRCDPSGPSPNCPDDYICCSDDPSAMDMTGDTGYLGALPDYSSSPDETRVPMFSGLNNDISTTGMCIQDGAVGDSGLLTAPGCPVPCNPTWEDTDIDTVCGGSGFLCCQTTELEEKDCIYDEPNDCVRPVNGADFFDDLTNWATSQHATHQGPNGKSCEAFLLAAGDNSSAAFDGCVRQLKVADQRGFCLKEDPANGVTACPADNAAYIDACENWAAENGKPMCDD